MSDLSLSWMPITQACRLLMPLPLFALHIRARLVWCQLQPQTLTRSAQLLHSQRPRHLPAVVGMPQQLHHSATVSTMSGMLPADVLHVDAQAQMRSVGQRRRWRPSQLCIRASTRLMPPRCWLTPRASSGTASPGGNPLIPLGHGQRGFVMTHVEDAPLSERSPQAQRGCVHDLLQLGT